MAVGTTKTTGLPARPFKGLRDKFAHLPDPEHCEGLVIEIDDLKGFAVEVRAVIISGIE